MQTRFDSGQPDKFCSIISSIKLFLSVAGDRTHIGTYVGVSPPPASNEKNKIKKTQKIILCFFYFKKLSTVLRKKSCVVF